MTPTTRLTDEQKAKLRETAQRNGLFDIIALLDELAAATAERDILDAVLKSAEWPMPLDGTPEPTEEQRQFFRHGLNAMCARLKANREFFRQHGLAAAAVAGEKPQERKD